MKAKLAYLTTPAPGVFILNVQPEGATGLEQFEITKAHLANIVIDGAALSLRENRVPAASPTSERETRTVVASAE